MSIKLFLSYSHKDENYKEALEEHLSPLTRSKLIESWNDRKIIPGTNWKDEIDDNLLSSDIILFLVSSSFINSDYSQEIEVKTAVEQHNLGKSILIPIIVRACHWQSMEFSSFQGLPKDALAVKSWPDEDEAWLDVVKGIEKVAKEITQKKTLAKVEVKIDNSNIEVTHSFLSWLNDNGVKLSHRLVGEVKLNDIYVIPDIQEYDEQTEKLIDINTSYYILENCENFIISGDEQIGKTSLFKFLYIEILKNSERCIYLHAKNINSNFDKVLEEALSLQYSNLTLPEFIIAKNKTLLIDDFEKISLKKNNINKFFNYLQENNIRVIVSCESNYSYISSDIPSFDNFRKPKILELGHQKREELISKWISLGKEESISSEGENYKQTDLVKSKIDGILKKKIVPARPIYILMILQMFEAHKKLNIELTSYGHCYQQLIYANFETGKINKEHYEKYLNVLTELSWWIFKSNKNPNYNDIDIFFNEYESKFLSSDRSNVVDSLIDCSILTTDQVEYKFKYPYIYYFFVGKKIAESYTESIETREATENLLKNLHKEDYANILVFVTHHTKNNWILNKIRSCLKDQFNVEVKSIGLWEKDDLRKLRFFYCTNKTVIPFFIFFEPVKETNFSREQLKFIQSFMLRIPDLVIEQREISIERKKKNEYLDTQEKMNSDDVDQDELSYDILSNINKVFKSMEIAGQIINNRHASIEKSVITHLAIDGIDAGLRFLNFFLNISDKAQESIVRFIAENIALDSNMTNTEVKEHAEQAYLHLTYNVLYATIQKIAHSIGSKEAFEVYRQIENSKNTPVHSLIKLSIDLQFNKTLNIQEIIRLNQYFSNNVVCQRLMKQLIIQHIYMYPVDFKEKQKIAQLLKIPLKQQRWMELENKGSPLKMKRLAI